MSREFVWIGGDIVEIAGVKGVWIPNEPRSESEFTSEEIRKLLNCPQIKEKKKKEIKEE